MVYCPMERRNIKLSKCSFPSLCLYKDCPEKEKVLHDAKRCRKLRTKFGLVLVQKPNGKWVNRGELEAEILEEQKLVKPEVLPENSPTKKTRGRWFPTEERIYRSVIYGLKHKKRNKSS